MKNIKIALHAVADDHSKLLLPAHLVTKEETADADNVADNIPENIHSLNKQQFDAKIVKIIYQ